MDEWKGGERLRVLEGDDVGRGHVRVCRCAYLGGTEGDVGRFAGPWRDQTGEGSDIDHIPKGFYGSGELEVVALRKATVEDGTDPRRSGEVGFGRHMGPKRWIQTVPTDWTDRLSLWRMERFMSRLVAESAEEPARASMV